MSSATDSRASSEAASQYVTDFYRQEAAKQRDFLPPKPRRPLAPVLALLTVPICLALTAYNMWGPRDTSPAFSQAQGEQAGRFAIFVVSRQVEGFRTQHGRLPDSLAEVDPQEHVVNYRSDGRSYVLTVDTGHRVLVYRDGEDLGPYERAATGVMRSAGQ